MIGVKEIVREARESMAGENKNWVTEEKMLVLLAAGARPTRNSEQDGGTYVTEAIYEGICFTTVSSSPLIPTNPIIH